jgi:hypothetical protein
MKEARMKKLKTGIIYHGGSIPVPSYLQKGTIELRDQRLLIQARGKPSQPVIDLEIPLDRLRRAAAEERKYYSSVGYFLVLEYSDEKGEDANLELEIRSFVRRGRAQALSRYWAESLSKEKGSCED